jgi:hypothetical protein
MEASGIPTKFLAVWASGTTSTYVRSVPVTTTDPNAASLALGWPPATFTPLASGGSPPDGRDANGINQAMTAWQQWQQAGGPITYDSTFQTAIGGYPKGAIVASATTFGVWWLSTADNNTTNPDTGGAGWVTAFSGRQLGTPISFASSGTYQVGVTSGSSAAARLIRVHAVGGGGAGGGSSANPSTNCTACSGGGAGSYAEAWFLVSALGGSVAVGIGAGAAGGPGPGSSGGTTTFGSFMSLPGGVGGGAQSYTTSVTNYAAQGAGGGAPTISGALYSLQRHGQPGPCGIVFTGQCMPGQGGMSPLGSGGPNIAVGAGIPGSGYGAGGGGAGVPASAGPYNGGNGSGGYVEITEYS